MIRSTQWKEIKYITILDRDWSDTLLSLMANDSADPSTVYKRKPPLRGLFVNPETLDLEWN